MQPRATLNVDLQYTKGVAAEKQVQLGFRVARRMVFGEQRHGTRPQRPEA